MRTARTERLRFVCITQTVCNLVRWMVFLITARNAVTSSPAELYSMCMSANYAWRRCLMPVINSSGRPARENERDVSTWAHLKTSLIDDNPNKGACAQRSAKPLCGACAAVHNRTVCPPVRSSCHTKPSRRLLRFWDLETWKLNRLLLFSLQIQNVVYGASLLCK